MRCSFGAVFIVLVAMAVALGFSQLALSENDDGPAPVVVTLVADNTNNPVPTSSPTTSLRPSYHPSYHPTAVSLLFAIA